VKWAGGIDCHSLSWITFLFSIHIGLHGECHYVCVEERCLF
jgi:hypothetical protein